MTAILGTIVAVTTLAACSGGGSGAAPMSSHSAAPAIFKPAPDYAPTEPPASLVAAAKKESGSLLWYESDPAASATQVLDAFQAQFPFVKKVQQVQLISSAAGVRIAQEAQAGTTTADVMTNEPATIGQLDQRKLLRHPDFTGAGIPEELVPEPYLAATTAGVFVFLYNTNLVSKAEAPKTWDDLLDPKWKGKIGTWSIPYAYAELAAIWGGDKATAYVKKLASQDLVDYESNFPIAQAVAAGEVPIGIAEEHTAAPTIAAGAPMAYNVPNPTAVSMLYSAIPQAAKNPSTAKLFIYWLETKAGAAAYEKANGRGNPLLPGTATAKLIAGKEATDFPAARADELSTWINTFTTLLKQQ